MSVAWYRGQICLDRPCCFLSECVHCMVMTVGVNGFM